MRNVSSAYYAKPIVGALYQDLALFYQALERLGRTLNPAEHISEAFPFHQTNYYESEMGANLTRRFVLLQNLIDPSEIKRYKLVCWQIEDALSHEGRRRVNLDPGYLDYNQLVLTSVKNLPHKIYLGGGVFAEIEMLYKNKTFHPMPWTYADYREHIPVFVQFRNHYAEHMKQAGQPHIPSPFQT